MPVGVLIEHRTRPGARDAVRAVWEELLQPAIAANPAHESYVYLFDVEDPDVIRAFQVYVDADAASAFLTTPAYAAYLAAVADLLVGPPVVHRTEVVWTKAPAAGAVG